MPVNVRLGSGEPCVGKPCGGKLPPTCTGGQCCRMCRGDVPFHDVLLCLGLPSLVSDVEIRSHRQVESGRCSALRKRGAL